MSIAERIFEHVNALPEPAAREVLDFVEFLEKRLAQGATAAPHWPPIVMEFEGILDMPPFERARNSDGCVRTDPAAPEVTP